MSASPDTVSPSRDGVRTHIRAVRIAANRIPTDRPEAEGTLNRDSTTLVLVEVETGVANGLGYTLFRDGDRKTSRGQGTTRRRQ